MARDVYVVGVGMTKFEKPGRRDWDYPDMVREAGTKALEDAGIGYEEIEQVGVGYVYGDSTAGQRAVYEPRSRSICSRCDGAIGIADVDRDG